MPWTAESTRHTFLQYFKERDHRIVTSSSLLPADPTLLFTNAGMVQFKGVFTGQEGRPYSRATSVQKCMRVSGKHNDLEQVGPSPRHHTFFEMLGNFSFGSYFKPEAIRYAWELMTDVFEIAPERLVITVHQDDEEAYRAWQEIPEVEPSQILRMGDATNFWSMGETGPCGPTSELHYDWGPDACTCGRPDCSVALDNDCGRWLEAWNLVFMEYDQAPDGTRRPLPKPGVDTGMGLERIAAILQQTPTNYDTDLFSPIMARLRELTAQSEATMRENIIPYRVISDHGRAMVFLIADGVRPSNEKQGYVLRMIIRRAIRFGKKLLDRPLLTEIARTVIREMGGFYPELRERQAEIERTISQEEQRFERTLASGTKRLEEIIGRLRRAGERVIPGVEVFKLHDTYGFPAELTADIAAEHGLLIDWAGFEREMAKQKARSRVSLHLEPATGSSSASLDISTPTRFTGYQSLEHESSLIEHVGDDIFVFAETPFYAEGGGQVADTGLIENLSRLGKAQVLDVQKGKRGIFLHRVKLLEGSFAAGDRCRLQVDEVRRAQIRRNHTATHILHQALREVLGYAGGIQAGSRVAPDELRFDFTHSNPLAPEEIAQIERTANRIILDDLPVQTSEEKLEEAKAKGAMALFSEDYLGKEKVRMVSITRPDGTAFSRELCGGTHVQRTGQIGLFKIISDEGIAAGVRRVRVASGEVLLAYWAKRASQLQQLAQRLAAPQGELLHKLESLLEEQQRRLDQIKTLRRALLAYKRKELLRERVALDGFSLVQAEVELEAEPLRELADLLLEELGEGVVLLGSRAGGKATLICKVSSGLTAKLHAGKIMRELAESLGGKGGGSPHFAQGGGTQPDKLPQALERGAALVRSGTA